MIPTTVRFQDSENIDPELLGQWQSEIERHLMLYGASDAMQVGGGFLTAIEDGDGYVAVYWDFGENDEVAVVSGLKKGDPDSPDG